MNHDDFHNWLIERGWSTWYSQDYWVNPKVVKDPTRQDYTNYGMSTADAYEFELNTPDKQFVASFLGLRI